MGKKVLKHFIIVAVVIGLIGLVDLIIVQVSGKAFLSIESAGEEYTSYRGIWYLYEKFYPLTTIDQPPVPPRLSFAPYGYLLLVAVVTAISLIPIRRKKK